jgi:hypothetical protein
MRSGLVIISKIRRQNATQVRLAEDDYVVKTLAADRANDPTRRGNNLLDVHRSNTITETEAIRRVAVSQQIAGHGVPRKRFGDLPREPSLSSSP